MSANLRRSDRIMLTIPLRIHGTDLKGGRISIEGRTIILNRHGARIQVPCRLPTGGTLRVVNLLTRREADFRVVGLVGPMSEKGAEYGVEYLESKDNIWGIHFPPSADGSGSKALLECRKCHEAALMPVSLVEVEVLETSGILSRVCPICDVTTPWTYSEKHAVTGTPECEGVAFGEAKTQAVAGGPEQRRHRRVTFQLPVRVRDYEGGVEVTKSENVSKGGFCFCSEKNYMLGQGLLVICPYEANDSLIETHARVVRRQEMEGVKRKIYGLRYTAPTS